MKRTFDSCDAKCENGLRGVSYGTENKNSDIPIWSHIMVGFAQNKWINLNVP